MSLKAGVIGVGMMGRNHARLYSELPDVELVGVADVSAENVANITHRYGGQGFTDLKRSILLLKLQSTLQFKVLDEFFCLVTHC